MALISLEEAQRPWVTALHPHSDRYESQPRGRIGGPRVPRLACVQGPPAAPDANAGRFDEPIACHFNQSAAGSCSVLAAPSIEFCHLSTLVPVKKPRCEGLTLE